MNGLDEFKANAISNGICEEYLDLWDKCISKKDIMDMALRVKAIDYLCDAIAKGWGISSQEIVRKFSPYINGKYIHEVQGYTSQMFCGIDGSLECKTTLLCAIDCNLIITIPKNHICEIYTTKSNLHLVGSGRVIVVTYGEKDDVTITCDDSVHYKRIHKKERDGN